MPFSEIAILIRLVLGAVATFFAILLWSKTREGAWLFVILAVLVNYGEIIFSTLLRFGIVAMDAFVLFGIPGSSLIQVFLDNLPLVLLIVAFGFALGRRRIK